MSIEQIKAARALLKWNSADLAEQANLSGITVRRYEAGANISQNAMQSLIDALEAAGIEFIPANGGGPGVRLAK